MNTALSVTHVRSGFIPGAVDMCDTVYFAQSSDLSWNCCACGLPELLQSSFCYNPREVHHQLHPFWAVYIHRKPHLPDRYLKGIMTV